MQNRNVNAGNGSKKNKLHQMNRNGKRTEKIEIEEEKKYMTATTLICAIRISLQYTHHFVKFNVFKYFMYENLEILSNTHTHTYIY